ncbi:phytanoyl-CoA dioxygenase [Shewanella maritima]|uniref:Phytanoyl-CoA dioxygenase n=1 Tax=Shewanella maritima TaxID=2520507 RepID=A0A411PJJ4_9GAMM|nr:phytanoyl-CoA dioxygenase family protein [Shewanella maritima]QBF83658.1 phytanoyl-CoA dioxygenase [Shewanella maritima]
MDIQQLVAQFQRDGYLVLDNFFDKQLMQDCNEAILDHFGMSPEFLHNDEFLSQADTEVIPWFPEREGVALFSEVNRHALLSELTKAILGDDWYSQYSMVMFSKQGTKGQAWHQDCPPENPEQFNLNRLVYTMDISEHTGGLTQVMPGSHKAGLLPSNGQPMSEDDMVTLTPKAGTLVLLHGHCWHKVTPVTGKYRVSTNYRSAPQGTPEDITDICVYRNMRYRFSTSETIEVRG